MTLDHSHSEAIDLAGDWLAQNPRGRLAQPVIPMLRQRFGLSVAEAVEACRVASKAREAAYAKP
ncbi:MAG: hypothetical protein E5X53_12490 [Mesorhizobium sp.]|uniref:hypothetical protein n=1 Tax=Mesorhizobium sp. TaxID=1871066 RepID=UPI00120F2BAA|nr:hypothetical protein [Mesorhizobium sp.]TIP74852.1 MAG: hypothetical protein E5X55_07860 [Mesorhizobium sp.]TIQ14636.1 MAG: hypothetical protein E5X57_04055 [Mesorhizobium sp.]TIR52181.1 MAG: hypothetical protein E5X53_12490 [Mesorhizobium sp.]TJV96263.1 MAG: hypothetical protein E5X52_19630 [Mesorhizobium sp.]